jgi:hypothetical protein
MADHGLDSWADDLSARERVREVATTLTRPRSVQWVKEEAGISAWQTAKDELEMLAEFGQLHAIQGDDGNTKYAPNYQRRYFQQLTELVNDHTREELREEIGDIQAQVDEWKAEFGVGSREALESTLTDEGLDSDAVRERSAVLRRWERQEDNKRLLKHALELYDDARSLYPGENDPSNTSVSLSQ